ncbi:MAG: PIG-L deacetylase family protein [Candidatus Woesearchaeota archaeon]
MKKKILILAPHTDDGELGCGGTISRYLREGKEIYYVAFSTCKKSLPKGVRDDKLKIECISATDSIGIKEKNRRILNFPVREFPKHRQQILEKMIALKKDIDPDIVFMPSSEDVHQDHKTIHEEGIRAFKGRCILGYEFMWNNFSFNTNYFIKLKKEDIDNKVDAIKEYSTQANRDYTSPKVIKGMANLRGGQISTEFAEAFEIIRWIE